ncbi:MAG: hypothetical protein AAFN13_19120, partial [Bacteroidota bacterium]
MLRERTGTANPLLNVTVPLSQIAFVDLDDDGDLDLAGASANYEGYGGDGFLSYYENTGSATVPAFAQRTGSANPFDGIRGSGLTLGDGDGDGDLDLVAAIDRDDSVDNVRGFLNVYRNVGTSTAPRFRQVPDARNPFADIEVVVAVEVHEERSGAVVLDVGEGVAGVGDLAEARCGRRADVA